MTQLLVKQTSSSWSPIFHFCLEEETNNWILGSQEFGITMEVIETPELEACDPTNFRRWAARKAPASSSSISSSTTSPLVWPSQFWCQLGPQIWDHIFSNTMSWFCLKRLKKAWALNSIIVLRMAGSMNLPRPEVVSVHVVSQQVFWII